MVSQMHPMQRKARKEYEAALRDGAPIRWIMLNKPSVRTVKEAINTLKRHSESYPDLADKYRADEIINEELAFERQLVLDEPNKEYAIAALSEWYNRTGKNMAHRYNAILNEVDKIPQAELEAERRAYVSDESKKKPVITGCIAKDKNMIESDDYSILAIVNMRKRIDALKDIRERLQSELDNETGKLCEIKKKMEDTQKKIESFRNVKFIMTGKEDEL